MKIRPWKDSDSPQIVALITAILKNEFPRDQGAYPAEDLKDLAKNYGGSSDLFLVAEGRMPCYVHNSVQPHDAAAGLIAMEEMGVKVTNWQGDPYTIFDTHILAAPPELYDEFYGLLFG